MFDVETTRWLRTEAIEEGDETLRRACDRALEGDEMSRTVVDETIVMRVGRAHREHRRQGLKG